MARYPKCHIKVIDNTPLWHRKKYSLFLSSMDEWGKQLEKILNDGRPRRVKQTNDWKFVVNTKQVGNDIKMEIGVAPPERMPAVLAGEYGVTVEKVYPVIASALAFPKPKDWSEISPTTGRRAGKKEMVEGRVIRAWVRGKRPPYKPYVFKTIHNIIQRMIKSWRRKSRELGVRMIH